MLHAPAVTPILARFAVEARWDEVPAAARQEAKRALLNFFAVALAGCRSPPVEIARKSLQDFSGHGQATVIGRRERTDALSAAFLNAAAANVLDFCDTHVARFGGGGVVRALRAAPRERRRAVAGVRSWRGDRMPHRPRHLSRSLRQGLAITSTCGVFGAATAAGKLMRLDERRTIWALASAATQACGLCECLGWPAKSIGVGNSARNGLWSAQLAQHGLEGPPEPIAGVQGFLSAMAEPPNWPALTEGLGETWEIEENSIKPYPCGFVIHPVLDCVLDWRRNHPRESIERVIVRGHPLLSDRADRPHVATGSESKVSVQHAVAAALVTGKAGLDQFSDGCVGDPAVLAMRRKVEVTRDPAIATVAAAVELWTSDGTKHSLSTPAARGSPSNPMTDKDIEDKLRTLAAGWCADYDAEGLIEAIWALEEMTDVASLLALTAPSG